MKYSKEECFKLTEFEIRKAVAILFQCNPEDLTYITGDTTGVMLMRRKTIEFTIPDYTFTPDEKEKNRLHT